MHDVQFHKIALINLFYLFTLWKGATEDHLWPVAPPDSGFVALGNNMNITTGTMYIH